MHTTLTITVSESVMAGLRHRADKQGVTPEKLISDELEHSYSTKPTPVFGSCKGMLTINSEDNEHHQHFAKYLP